jgi:hypothetical protein
VAEDRSGDHARHRASNHVEVGAADRARRDAHDRVIGLLELGLRDVVEPNVAYVVKDYGLHCDTSVSEGQREQVVCHALYARGLARTLLRVVRGRDESNANAAASEKNVRRRHMKQSAQARESAHVTNSVNDGAVAGVPSSRRQEPPPGQERIRRAPDFHRWSVEELRALAFQLQIPGARSKSRQELIEFFKSA